MKQPLEHETMAMRAARELRDGDVVNLGIGIPGLAANFVPEGRGVTFHAENGVLGFGPLLGDEEGDVHLINAGGQFVSPAPGMSFFGPAEAFSMIRGGHIDVAILGGMQVSEKGDLANWMVAGSKIGNVGGAMDLATGAKRIIVTMDHETKDGKPKIVKRCTYPLTGLTCVDLIITNLAVIKVTPKGLELIEYAPGYTPADIQALTEPKLIISRDVCEISL